VPRLGRKSSSQRAHNRRINNRLQRNTNSERDRTAGSQQLVEIENNSITRPKQINAALQQGEGVVTNMRRSRRIQNMITLTTVQTSQHRRNTVNRRQRRADPEVRKSERCPIEYGYRTADGMQAYKHTDNRATRKHFKLTAETDSSRV